MTANGSGASGQTSYSTPGTLAILVGVEQRPEAVRVTIAPARYCAPSKRPAAVATAFLPPKSIDAAPPTSECALWMKNAIMSSSVAAAPRRVQPLRHQRQRQRHADEGEEDDRRAPRAEQLVR